LKVVGKRFKLEQAPGQLAIERLLREARNEEVNGEYSTKSGACRCGGAGVLQVPIDYPCFESTHYCDQCEMGQMLAARISDIVYRTLRQGRVRAA